MLINGLAKGVLMLVLGAAFTWVLITSFEHRAEEQIDPGQKAVPSIAHTGKRSDTQWMF